MSDLNHLWTQCFPIYSVKSWVLRVVLDLFPWPHWNAILFFTHLVPTTLSFWCCANKVKLIPFQGLCTCYSLYLKCFPPNVCIIHFFKVLFNERAFLWTFESQIASLPSSNLFSLLCLFSSQHLSALTYSILSVSFEQDISSMKTENFVHYYTLSIGNSAWHKVYSQ